MARSAAPAIAAGPISALAASWAVPPSNSNTAPMMAPNPAAIRVRMIRSQRVIRRFLRWAERKSAPISPVGTGTDDGTLIGPA